MELTLVILQGVGLALAAGIRPFFPLLITAVLARSHVGIDLRGTDFLFMQESWFMLVVIVVLAGYLVAQRKIGAEKLEESPAGASVSGLSIASAGLLFAASLADYGHYWQVGLVAGVVVSMLSNMVSRQLLQNTRKRLDFAAQNALTVYADGCALVVAALAVLLPPTSVIALAGVVAMLLAARRRSDEKYAGLRILK